MAIVKANYVKRGREAKARAKASLRYITHRGGTKTAGKPPASSSASTAS